MRPGKCNGVWVRRYADVESRTLCGRRPPYVKYLSAMPGWDNTPRRGDRGYAIVESSPAAFTRYFRRVVNLTLQREELRKQGFIFLNAWNEWGEGAHLEPDEKHGYANLEAIRNVLN